MLGDRATGILEELQKLFGGNKQQTTNLREPSLGNIVTMGNTNNIPSMNNRNTTEYLYGQKEGTPTYGSLKGEPYNPQDEMEQTILNRNLQQTNNAQSPSDIQTLSNVQTTYGNTNVSQNDMLNMAGGAVTDYGDVKIPSVDENRGYSDIDLLNMGNSVITPDTANEVVSNLNATNQQSNDSLEDALFRADRDRQLMEAEFDLNQLKDKNVSDAAEEGSISGDMWAKTKNFLADEEKMLTLAQAFNTMRLDPDDALSNAISKRLETVQKNKGVSKTVSQLRTMAAMESDPAKKQKILNAAAMMENNPEQSSTIYKEILGSMIGTKGDKESWERGWKIQQGFIKDDGVKEFGKQSTAFRRVLDSAQNPSAAGDLALIFNYMKILDPGSTVREGEFANAENSAGVPDRIKAEYNKVRSGERLGDKQRNDFVERARDLFSGAVEGYEEKRNYYSKQATDANLNAEQVIGNPFSTNIKYVNPEVKFSDVPKAQLKDLGFTNKADWDKFWNSRTYIQKVEILMEMRK